MKNETTTTNFAEFGWRERKLASELLEVSIKQGFPTNFYDDGVTIMMNKISGNVFFTNSKYQVAMMNGEDLESFYYTPYEGHEGFAEELLEMYREDEESWNEEDVQYLKDMGILED